MTKFIISLFAAVVDSRLNDKLMELLTPKVQINTSIRTNAAGEVLERSTLLNIRTDAVQEAIELFAQLKSQMQGQDQIEVSPAKPAELTANDLFPDEEKPITYNWPLEGGEPAPQCPDCGAQMVKRKSKTGSEFWGCSNFRKGCRGTRQV
jgi:hypothetical protein